VSRPEARRQSAAARQTCLAVTTPGLERLAAEELRALGFTPRELVGGVEFDADARGIFTANLHLRTVTRVLVRVAEFRATAFYELEKQARDVPWASLLVANSPVRLRVTCKKSRLYHSDAVAERVGAAIARAVPSAAPKASVDDAEDEGAEAELLVVRFERDVCVISVDSSGAPLHRRGYRLATAKAPIRETLAAAMLLALAYDGSKPLLDPMCGSGTIAIEAALLARRIAPGLSRRFSCEKWPGAQSAAFERIRSAASAAVLTGCAAPILASDRDGGAIRAAVENATRARVSESIEFRERPISAIDPLAPPGFVLVNPPYGERIGEPGGLRDLYAQLGNVTRTQCAGSTFAMISADRAFEASVNFPFSETLRFKNGGIPVRFVQTNVPGRR
jgi:putative N6-adenine-specific DNA methylase